MFWICLLFPFPSLFSLPPSLPSLFSSFFFVIPVWIFIQQHLRIQVILWTTNKKNFRINVAFVKIKNYQKWWWWKRGGGREKRNDFIVWDKQSNLIKKHKNDDKKESERAFWEATFENEHFHSTGERERARKNLLLLHLHHHQRVVLASSNKWTKVGKKRAFPKLTRKKRWKRKNKKKSAPTPNNKRSKKKGTDNAKHN